MPKLLVLQGLQASGKSTFAKKFCEKNKDWIRICRDDFRHMRGKYWVPSQEKLITEWEHNAMLSALKRGYNVVSDGTNLNKYYLKEREDFLRKEISDLQVEYNKSFLEVSLEECIKRDLKRANSVGEKVIRGFYNKYLAPPKQEYNEDSSLPHCIIVDVDGTLAQMSSGRSPYDWYRVKEDTPNKYVIDVVRSRISYWLQTNQTNNRVVIFTGRDGVCLEDTKEWLEHHNIPYDDIYIRPAGSTEKDYVIKERMFEENIRGKLYVELVIDDRLQVCRLWNQLGLPLLRAGDPDADF